MFAVGYDHTIFCLSFSSLFVTAAGCCCCCCYLQSTFKSDYLSLVNAAGTAMAELLCSKQELAEVRYLQALHVCW